MNLPLDPPASQCLWLAGKPPTRGGLCYLSVWAAALSWSRHRGPNNLIDWRNQPLTAARARGGPVDMAAIFWSFLHPGCWGEMSHWRKSPLGYFRASVDVRLQCPGTGGWAQGPVGPSHILSHLPWVRKSSPWQGFLASVGQGSFFPFCPHLSEPLFPHLQNADDASPGLTGSLRILGDSGIWKCFACDQMP